MIVWSWSMFRSAFTIQEVSQNSLSIYFSRRTSATLFDHRSFLHKWLTENTIFSGCPVSITIQPKQRMDCQDGKQTPVPIWQILQTKSFRSTIQPIPISTDEVNQYKIWVIFFRAFIIKCLKNKKYW
jgi:hypothetical protein